MNNIFYKKRYKYQLEEEYSIMTSIKPDWDVITGLYTIEKTGLVTARYGYAWNGANVALDSLSIIRASLIHDVGCQAIVEGRLARKHKHQVDNEFRRICLEDGMSLLRVWYTFKAVDKYSCLGRENPTLSAPDPDAINADRSGGA